MFTQDRDKLRQAWADIWSKARANEPLDPLEQQVAQVIADHPEYHNLLENRQLGGEYLPEMGQTNPFLHMSMHLAIREQVNTDRPKGIAHIYKQLCLKYNSPLEAEHAMMECLGEALWQAQRTQQPPDEAAYLQCIKQLLEP
jgi:hypothetical protein